MQYAAKRHDDIVAARKAAGMYANSCGSDSNTTAKDADAEKMIISIACNVAFFNSPALVLCNGSFYGSVYPWPVARCY